jgi:hypothetical protein
MVCRTAHLAGIVRRAGAPARAGVAGRMSTRTPRVTFAPDEAGTPHTGSTLLRGAMAEAVARFPGAFGDLTIPDDPARFKRALPDLLVQFEARRADAEVRVDIARQLAAYVPARALLDGEPLAEAIVRHPPLPEPLARRGTAPPGWTPSLTEGDRTWTGRELGALADRLLREHHLTRAAADALRWMAEERLSQPLDLSGETFVILGAAAELAPTTLLLRAGARVLWIDAQPPTVSEADHAGTLVHLPAAGDLLQDPAAVYAAVAAEAGHRKVHALLYAYAPGGGRELLLTAVMNTLVASLPPSALRSVTMLVSPTTPGEVLPEDRAAREARRAAAPGWQRLLARARLLPEPAHHGFGDTEIARSIVAMQGPTYLAAQYLTKMMAAEAWAADLPGVRVSANVAGITHTRSLEHPLFLAGFLGAQKFGIRVFHPDETRVLSTLLMLHDLTNPEAPGADATGGPAAQARRLAAQAVHGGVRSVPFVFDATIRVAAMLGLGQQPGLLLRLARGR